jgi:hypothetical protein
MQKLAVDGDWAYFVDGLGGANQKQKSFAFEANEGGVQQPRDGMAGEIAMAPGLAADNAAVVADLQELPQIGLVANAKAPGLAVDNAAVVADLQELLQIALVAKVPSYFGGIVGIAYPAAAQAPKKRMVKKERLGMFVEMQLADDAMWQERWRVHVKAYLQ